VRTPQIEITDQFRATLLAEVNRLLCPRAGMGILLSDVQEMKLEEGDAGFYFYTRATLYSMGMEVGEVWVRGKAHMESTLGVESPFITRVQLKRVTGAKTFNWSWLYGQERASKEEISYWDSWDSPFRRPSNVPAAV
jgi:hypothetical protein